MARDERIPWEDIPGKYPLLLDAVKWVALLSDSEGIACIRDYLDGYEYSSEAVNHFGGTRKVIERAWATRHHAAQQRRAIQNMLRRTTPQDCFNCKRPRTYYWSVGCAYCGWVDEQEQREGRGEQP
jgi:hypothetical protein